MNEEFLALLSAYGPIVLMVVLFYFLLYRPQQAEQKRRNEMLTTLHKGNKIVTVGGIYGEIVDIKDDVLDLKIADKVVIKVTRASVSRNISQGKSAKESPEQDDAADNVSSED